MKKAKEYVKQYLKFCEEQNFNNLKNDNDTMLQKIYLEFTSELPELQKQRNVKTLQGLKGIILELNNKWYSFANQVNKELLKKFPTIPEIINGYITKDGFITALKIDFPETKIILQSN